MSEAPAQPAITVLVTGAGGFIGGFVVAALRRAGYRVRRGVRGRVRADDEVCCDFATMTTAAQWRPLLAGVDVVVNVAGILRETRSQRFDCLHHAAPLALALACVDAGVQRFVQISALGVPDDGAFIASKHRFDSELLALPLSAVVLRPSVVYSAAGSYGGTSLLRALAALPGIMPLPGDGRWRIQPLAAEDLAELVRRACASDVGGVYDVGGPQVLSLRDYLRAWRRWLGFGAAIELRAPIALVDLAVVFGDWLGRGPMGAATWRMLKRGNVVAADAGARLQADFAFAPHALGEVLAQHPSQTQDRWQARLYLLAPLLRIGVVALFLISAWAGFMTPAAEIERIAAGSALAHWHPVAWARVAGGVDALLALALLAGVQAQRVIAAMSLLVLAYTVVFGVLTPAQWLDPLGGLAKNLVVLPALVVLWVLTQRRG